MALHHRIDHLERLLDGCSPSAEMTAEQRRTATNGILAALDQMRAGTFRGPDWSPEEFAHRRQSLLAIIEDLKERARAQGGLP